MNVILEAEEKKAKKNLLEYTFNEIYKTSTWEALQITYKIK